MENNDEKWFKEHFPQLEIDGLWSVLPDTARLLYSQIEKLQPHYILEFGSGISTAILAKAASSYGGFVFSLEHQGLWLERTLGMCRACNLDNFEIIKADIVDKDFGKGRSFKVYDPEKISEKKYDFVFIDGPPGVAKDDPGRFGTLYAAWPFLSSNATIVIDDAHRTGEQQAVLEWMKVFGKKLTVQYLKLQKPAFLMSVEK